MSEPNRTGAVAFGDPISPTEYVYIVVTVCFVVIACACTVAYTVWIGCRKLSDRSGCQEASVQPPGP